MEEERVSLKGFWGSMVSMEIIGVMLVLLVAVWTGHYRGGFAWNEDISLQFNWHPMLMTFGMIFLYGNGMVSYRIFRSERKSKLKVVHAVVLGIAFILAVIALKAVFDTHNLADPPIANLYSLHSWIGLIAVALFTCQWLSGFVAFLFPGLHRAWRASYMPIHRFFGLAIFTCAIAAAITGLLEKAHFALSGEYQNLGAEAILINVIGVVVMVFAVVTVYITARYSYRRCPLPEDELLLADTVTE